MSIAKKPFKAGLKKVDPEVKDAYHDEVLNWAIDNLANIVTSRLGLDSAQAVAELEKARSAIYQFLDTDIDGFLSRAIEKKQLHSWRGAIDLDSVAIGAFKTAKMNIRGIKRQVDKLGFEPADAVARVESFEVMKRVTYYEKKLTRNGHSQEIKEIPAGYIDLFATGFSPSGFSFGIENCSKDVINRPSFHDQEHAVRFARSINAENISLHPVGKRFSIFFSVRTDAFTLGEVLQEMKDLEQLEDQQQEVALIVDHIPHAMRIKIEAEGFMVFARSDFA